MNATITTATATRGVWPLASARIATARAGPTWAEWSAALARQSVQGHWLGNSFFSDRELAHLTFVRWLYQTGRSLPAGDDREGR